MSQKCAAEDRQQKSSHQTSQCFSEKCEQKNIAGLIDVFHKISLLCSGSSMNDKTNSINFVEYFPNAFKITHKRSSHIEADMSGYSAFRRGRFNEHIFLKDHSDLIQESLNLFNITDFYIKVK